MDYSKILENTRKLEDILKEHFHNFKENSFLSLKEKENLMDEYKILLMVHDNEGYYRGAISFNENFSPDAIYSQTGELMGFYHYVDEKKFIEVLQDGKTELLEKGDGIELILKNTKQIKEARYKIK